MPQPDKFVKSSAAVAEPGSVGFWVQVQSDGVCLYAREWTPPAGTATAAAVTFIHGLGEHIGRYEHVFSAMAQRGIYVFAWDQRGFGRTVMLSPPTTTAPPAGQSVRPVATLGDSGGWQTSMDDIWRACDYTRAACSPSPVPHFLMGQSMGGLLALWFAVTSCRHTTAAISPTGDDGKVGLAGVIAMSPACAPGYHIPAVKKTVGGWLSGILGSVNIPTELDVNGLSSDPAVAELYKADPLTHGMGSLRTLNGILKYGEELLKSKYKEYQSALPLLMSFGTLDRVTSYAAGAQFVDKVVCSDKTFRSWEGYMHELHNEPAIKEKVIEEYVQWILQRSGTQKK